MNYLSSTGPIKINGDQYGLISVHFDENIITDYEFQNLMIKWHLLIRYKIRRYQEILREAEQLKESIDLEIKNP